MSGIKSLDVVVDGINIIGREWNIVRPTTNLTVGPLLRVTEVEVAKILKGTRTFKFYSSVWRIRLFTACDLDISLFICCREKIRISYELLLSEIKSCLKIAIEASGESASAKRFAQVS